MKQLQLFVTGAFFLLFFNACATSGSTPSAEESKASSSAVSPVASQPAASKEAKPAKKQGSGDPDCD